MRINLMGKLGSSWQERGLEESGKVLYIKYKNGVHQREQKKEETDNQRKRETASIRGGGRERTQK